MRKVKRKVIRSYNNTCPPDEKIFPPNAIITIEQELYSTDGLLIIKDCNIISTWLSGKPVGAS